MADTKTAAPKRTGKPKGDDLTPYVFHTDSQRARPGRWAIPDGMRVDIRPLAGAYVQDDGYDIPREMLSGLTTAGNLGAPVDPDCLPTRQYRLDKAYKDCPSVFYVPNFYCISTALKALIEELEPGIHRFLPVDVTTPGGRLIEARFLLNVCQRLTFYDMSRTRLHESGQFKNCAVAETRTFDFSLVGGHHLWAEKHGPFFLFVSPTFVAEFKKRKLTGALFKRYEPPLAFG